MFPDEYETFEQSVNEIKRVYLQKFLQFDTSRLVT